MKPAAPRVPVSLPDRRRPDAQAIRTNGDGQRTWVLTLEEVAAILKTDVRTVRKLIRVQREEDAAAEREARAPRLVGLRAARIAARITRVREEALGAYLRQAEGARNKSGQ
jgi:hypothetical protein